MTAESHVSLPLKLRDLAVGAAFASMALSAALPIAAIFVFGIGLLLAVLGLRILGGRSNLTALLLAAAAVLLYARVATGAMDFVVAASLFAALTALCRMLATSEPKTDGQVLLMSFLMLCGGAALSADLLFAVALAAFTVLAMLATGLAIAESSAAEGEIMPFAPLIRQLGWAAAATLLGGALLFACLPRFSWQLAAHRGPLRGGATPGLAEEVSLSGSGRSKVNPRIIGRVKLDPDPTTPTLEGYWLARTFETFNGRTWQARPTRRRTWGKVRVAGGQQTALHQSIKLLPGYGSRTVFALQWPTKFSAGFARTTEGSRPALFVELRGQEIRMDEAAPSYAYEVDSTEQLGDGGVLAPSGNASDYLQLPAKLDPRIETLARKAAGDTNDALAAAQNIERFLRVNYHYSLDTSVDAADPLADFLFNAQAGHCEQFATALTVMLRSLGIPARLAAGFFGGERSGNEYVIRAGDAHTWTHLILPDGRLISLDATPESSRSTQSPGALAWLVRAYETLSERWRNSVVDYSLQDQADLVDRLRSIRPPPVPSTMTLLALLAAAGVVLWRRADRGRPVEHEATAMLRAAERILAGAGVRTRSNESVEELERRLARARHPLSSAFSRLTRRYLEARFGGRRLRPQEKVRLIADLRSADRWTRRHAP